MLLTAITLGLTAIITFLQSFFGNKYKVAKIILGLSILALLVFSLRKANIEKEENEKRELEAKENDAILRSTKKLLEEQTIKLDSSFTDLGKKIDQEGLNTSPIANALKGIQTQVSHLATTSNTSFAKVLHIVDRAVTIPIPNIASLPTDTFTPAPISQKAPIDSVRLIKIPLGDNTAQIIDRKNQFSVVDEKTDQINKIGIILNGNRYYCIPGEQFNFEAADRALKHLVYKGKIQEQQVFFITDF